MAATIEQDAHQIARVRAFNRFYTRRIGALHEGLLDSPYPLTHARVLFELAQRAPVSAREVGDALGLDAGYLSRILRGFQQDGLVERERSVQDGRSYTLRLTAHGQAAFERIDRASQQATAVLLSALGARARDRLLQAMDEVERNLSPSPTTTRSLSIREHRIGDIGWAIELHGRLYAQEYAWDAGFEALVATLFARFATAHDPVRERCWIAEVDTKRAGCVFVVRNEQDPDAAQLRCLLVDPDARGLGAGRKLVETCLEFARAAGYRRMLLWTNDVLVSARRIYEACGFVLVEETPHHSFGHDLVGQVWAREL